MATSVANIFNPSEGGGGLILPCPFFLLASYAPVLPSPPSQPITLLPSFPPSLIYSRALFPSLPAVSNVQYPAVTADWDLSYTQFMSANFVGVGGRGQLRFGLHSVMSAFSHSAGLAHRVPCLRAGPRQCDTVGKPRRIDGLCHLHHAVKLRPGVCSYVPPPLPLFLRPPPPPPVPVPPPPPLLHPPPTPGAPHTHPRSHPQPSLPMHLWLPSVPSCCPVAARWAFCIPLPAPAPSPPGGLSVFPPCPRPFPASSLPRAMG